VILYHGSYAVINQPNLSFSRLRTDFGKGFYLTPLKEQAISWAQRFCREHGQAFVSEYMFLPNSDDKLPREIKTLEYTVLFQVPSAVR